MRRKGEILAMVRLRQDRTGESEAGIPLVGRDERKERLSSLR